ncbi:SDR family NAD(P)-dependent oxidoreductase [Halobium salinum]|uniref:SDR family NAD(P)-dependent oxidoreductase n=1 Tax=Halobium salinum TaxID=1364940 RepID=A0ABD5PEQ3_9EURY|nr:SDR family NAD(P)-dependent oxidoreductase [Halobium salinum]
MKRGTSGKGRVVVVTGANEGIGYHTSAALLERGYRVAGFDVDGEGFEALEDAYPDHARYHRCDVTVDGDVQSAVDAVVAEWGRIDVLLNNAAVFSFGSVEDRSLDDTRREFEVNYFGYLRAIRAVLPQMRKQGGGIVHCVSSGVGSTGHPGLSGYASSKAAIEALVRSLRLELRHEPISVTLMYPPATNTRSAARLGYPSYAVKEPAEVGRKLAAKIESTGPVVAADWSTRLGMAVMDRFPSLVERGTARFVTEDGVSLGRVEG